MRVNFELAALAVATLWVFVRLITAARATTCNMVSNGQRVRLHTKPLQSRRGIPVTHFLCLTRGAQSKPVSFSEIRRSEEAWAFHPSSDRSCVWAA